MSKKSDWTIATLKEYFERILSERQTALDAALVAQKSAVSSAFSASDKAITKSEDAQREYNSRSNEFRASLDDQAKLLLSRTEADTRFQQLRDLIDSQARQIVELQKFESRGEGGSKTAADSKATAQWLIGAAITVAIAVTGGVASLIFFLATRK